MTQEGKGKSEKPSAGSDKTDKSKKPAIPRLSPDTEIGKNRSSSVRTNVQVPILTKNDTLGHGGGSVRTLTEKIRGTDGKE